MKCPTCGKPANWKDNPFRPFCCERCQLVDLGRWVNEEYRVPDQRASSDQSDASREPFDSDGAVDSTDESVSN